MERSRNRSPKENNRTSSSNNNRTNNSNNNRNNKSNNNRNNSNNRTTRSNTNHQTNRSNNSNRNNNRCNCSRQHLKVFSSATDKKKCVLCNKYHAVKSCPKFLSMTIKKRRNFVESKRYCINCLARSHDWRACSSMDRCKKCNAFHHTLLHPNLHSITTNQLRRRSRYSNNQPTPTNQQQITSTAASTAVISEAIKSLATILCSSK